MGDILLPVIYLVHFPLYFLDDNNHSSLEMLDADSNVCIVPEPASTIWDLLLLILGLRSCISGCPAFFTVWWEMGMKGLVRVPRDIVAYKRRFPPCLLGR